MVLLPQCKQRLSEVFIIGSVLHFNGNQPVIKPRYVLQILLFQHLTELAFVPLPHHYQIINEFVIYFNEERHTLPFAHSLFNITLVESFTLLVNNFLYDFPILLRVIGAEVFDYFFDIFGCEPT